MTHFGKSALTALLVTILVGVFVGCGEQEEEPVLRSIAVTSPPDKTVYGLGETLDLSGLVVTGTYSDGTTLTEAVSLANVTGYDANSLGAQILTVTVNGTTATFTVTVSAAALVSIAVTTPPAKTVYVLGEALDLTGLAVTGTYTDNTTQTEPVSLTDISGYNTNTLGAQILTVTVNGKTATFTVMVNAAALVSIAVTTPPAKTVYVLGEALDLSGLVVTGTYSDSTTKTETVSLTDISGYDADTAGEQTLTVTVNGKTATFSVEVNAAALVSIAVTTPPAKTAYAKGEDLDLSGLVVTGTYSDSTTQTETVSPDDVRGYNATSLGEQTLTVTVNNKTATFTVRVNAAALVSIAVTAPPAKTVYAKGEDLDLSGLAVTGTYTDKTTQAETVSLSDISGYNANTLGAQTLTVTVNNKTATFSVTVNAAALVSIAVTSQPAKTAYAKGEDLDLAGLVVTGTYTDKTTQAETVSLTNVSGYNTNTLGAQTLTVTINGTTATFSVTVNAAALVSIAVTTPPTKTAYAKGEALDIAGLVVTGTYTDQTTRQESVTISNVSGYDATSLGQQTLNVDIGGKFAAFSVTVKTAWSVTMNLEDPIDGVEEGVSLSKTGAGGTPTSVELTITGSYDSYEWHLNDSDTPVSISATYTLSAAKCLLGENFLTIEVKKADGRRYSKEVTFNVVR